MWECKTCNGVVNVLTNSRIVSRSFMYLLVMSLSRSSANLLTMVQSSSMTRGISVGLGPNRLISVPGRGETQTFSPNKPSGKLGKDLPGRRGGHPVFTDRCEFFLEGSWVPITAVSRRSPVSACNSGSYVWAYKGILASSSPRSSEKPSPGASAAGLLQ